MSPERKLAWRWRAHALYLAALGLWWGVAFFSLKELPRSAASGGEALLVGLAALGQGLAHAAVIALGFGLLFYAGATTIVMKVLERRALAPLWIHGSLAVVVLVVGTTSEALDRRRHTLEEQAYQESTARAEAARAAMLACVQLQQLTIHPGSPLQATVRLAPEGCPGFELQDLTLEGQAADRRAWSSRYFRPHETLSAARDFELVDDGPLTDATGWTWTVRVSTGEGEQVFCGPGADSPIPGYLKCRPLRVVSPGD